MGGDLSAPLPDELLALRRILRQRIKTLHPDISGPKYDPDAFEATKRALDELGNEVTASTALATVSKPTVVEALVQYIKEAQEAELESSVRSFTNAVGSDLERLLTRTRHTRATSGAVAGMITALWGLPRAMRDNPVAMRFVDSGWFTVVWLFAVGLLAVLWGLTWYAEAVKRDVVQSLKLQEVQNKLFDDYIRYTVVKGQRREEGASFVFTADEFVQDIKWTLAASIRVQTKHKDAARRRILQMGQRLRASASRVAPAAVESLGTLILARAEQKLLIRRVSGTSLAETYELEEEPR